MTLTLGTLVRTLSGNIRGIVEHIPDPDHIDVVSTTGQKYRNCQLDMWCLAEDTVTLADTPELTGFARGDVCFTTVQIDGEIFTRTGTVLVSGKKRCYVQFDADKSQWLEAAYLWPGQGSNEL